MLSITQKGEAIRAGLVGVDEMEHWPASDGKPNTPLGPVMPTNFPAAPLGAVRAIVPGRASTVKGPKENGPPGVVASLTKTLAASVGVAEGPTVNPAVNVPAPFMVQVLLTTSAAVSPPPVVIEQLRTVPVETNPPPVRLTIPQPGGASVGDITIAFAKLGDGTFVNPDGPDENEPPEKLTVIVYPASAAPALTVNVPVADPDPPEMVQACGEAETTCGAPLLVIVQGPTVSEGRPLTVTVTVVPGKPAAGEIVIEGATTNVVEPLSAPHVIVRV